MPRRACLLATSGLLALTACTSGQATPDRTTTPTTERSTSAAPSSPSSPPNPASSTSAPSNATPTSSAPVLTTAQRVLGQMTQAQRVGQLFMVDCPTSGPTEATIAAIASYHVGSVILDGTSYLSQQQIAATSAGLQQLAPAGVGLFVATDQEGGLVQRLRGPGFSAIPSAVQQGMSAPSTLRSDARQWGSELRAAGVNVDLAPVLDTVPPHSGGNPPVGDLDREYGHDPVTVSSHGGAVAQGLSDAGVDPTVKHFPGLGRVSGNTDLASGVLDTVTTRHDQYLAPFADAVRSRVPFVMISTAIYTRIDPDRPAAFSPTIVTGMLRGDLDFGGVIISDDVGIAKQLSDYSIGGRAVSFIAAGGDIVLTVDATQTGEMTAAVLARARRDPAFKRQVDAAALAVLRAKQDRGLLH
ncbi:MAG: Beta-N-acetylhexosaminidase [Pseudonocardiales bacterium]|nr:Beta-N-acetylhexosaminidase [Pseudonocardiales bacterium]